MTRINNYDDLIAERRRTELVIDDRKQVIHDHLEDIKEKIAPLFSVLAALKIFKKDDSGNHSVLKLGSSLAIDLLVGQKLLKNAGWLARLIVPTLLKTVSSGVIGFTKKK
jgi:hypothetical protein